MTTNSFSKAAASWYHGEGVGILSLTRFLCANIGTSLFFPTVEWRYCFWKYVNLEIPFDFWNETFVFGYVLLNVSSPPCFLFCLFVFMMLYRSPQSNDAVKVVILKFIVLLNPVLVAIILATNYFVLIVVSATNLYFGFLNYWPLLLLVNSSVCGWTYLMGYHCYCL